MITADHVGACGTSGQRPRRFTLSSALLVIALTVVVACSGLDARDPGTRGAAKAQADIGTAVTPAADAGWIATGALHFPVAPVDDASFDAGFSMYVAAWPLQQTYPGPLYQTGLPSTWMTSAALDDVDVELYSTIEGGLGWWRGTRFPTDAPKFSMGGVSANFFEWANGPGSGGGLSGDVDPNDWRWDEPQGKYGVAQLSPYVLFPPDGLNLNPETNGELFGYGYHPLPIIDQRTSVGSAGSVETGDKSWTLFLDTENFRGPLAFFVPEFFTKPLVTEPELGGMFTESPFLDTSPAAPNQSYDVETHDIPAVHAISHDGVTYARITTTQFPASGRQTGDESSAESTILDKITTYQADALARPAAEWFDGGAVPSGVLDEKFSRAVPFARLDDPAEHFGWLIIPPGVEDGDPEYLIDWSSMVDVDVSRPATFRYRWNLDVVERIDDSFVLPEYYRLDDAPEAQHGKVWTPVPVGDVPVETGLVDYVFPEFGSRDTRPFETPTDPQSVWRTPGPVAGPFETALGDGTVVTYSWYRFVDQPAIRHWQFTDTERTAIQARVEAIHAEWLPDRSYLRPPTDAPLAALDEGLLVEPPPGLEIGYVPIVTRQALADGP